MRPYSTIKNRQQLRRVVRDFQDKWTSGGGLWYMARLGNQEFEAQLMAMYKISRGMASKVRWILRGGITRDIASKEIFGFDKLTA